MRKQAGVIITLLCVLSVFCRMFKSEQKIAY